MTSSWGRGETVLHRFLHSMSAHVTPTNIEPFLVLEQRLRDATDDSNNDSDETLLGMFRQAIEESLPIDSWEHASATLVSCLERVRCRSHVPAPVQGVPVPDVVLPSQEAVDAVMEALVWAADRERARAAARTALVAEFMECHEKEEAQRQRAVESAVEVDRIMREEELAKVARIGVNLGRDAEL